MKRIFKIAASAALVVGFIAPVSAWAQAAAAAPGRAACLVKPSEPLKYPEQDDERRASGGIQARLSFDRPDGAPKVEILRWSGTQAMKDAAEIYLLRYRLPCLGAGERVTLEQEVSFSAIDMQRGSERQETNWACLRTPGRLDFFEEQQTGTMIKQRPRGNVLLELSFDAPDAPPKVKLIYDSGPAAFRQAAMDHVAGYRLPCFKPGSPPATMTQQLTYRGTGRDADLVLKDMGIVAFLGAVSDADKVPVKFDLDTMACPFKLRFTAYRPAAPNALTEVGPHVPARLPFMEWLAGLTLRLDKRQFEALMGAEMAITVPCGKIEL